METDKEDYEKSEEEKIVHIKVKWSTRERLKELGKKGDTYEDVITGLVDGESPTEWRPRREDR